MTRYVKKFLITLSLFSLLFAPAFCHAEGSLRGHFGLLGGLAFPADHSATFSTGFGGGWRFWGPFGAGIFMEKYGINADIESSNGSASIVTATNYYGLDGNFFGSGTLQRFLFGVRLGLAGFKKTADANGSGMNLVIDGTGTYLFVGPRICYDYPIISRISGGGELSYLRGIGIYSPSSVNIMATVKVWW